MWNDTDTPLAYLITFRCFATWLHGDKRGSIDRFHNRYKSPYIQPNERWRLHNVGVLEGEPVVLNASQRQSVDRAIRETCDFRKWHLYALNVRTNHIHAVVSIGALRPEGKCNKTDARGWILAARFESLVRKREQQIPLERA